jgi:hypothetical protein
MDVIRLRFARTWRVLPPLLLMLAAMAPASPMELRDAPVVWYEDDAKTIEEPAERDPNLLWDMMNDAFFLPVGRVTHPGRLVRRIGTLFGGEHVPPAENVNSLDEVPNSTWFTNRIGFYPMTPEEVARGPGSGTGPDTGGPWTIIRAKTQGATPGFVIRDSKGGVYLVKFDAPGLLGMATSAGVISNRILHAVGYNVPEDVLVIFHREDLVLGDDVKMTLPDGSKRLMTTEDIDQILSRVDPHPDGGYLAISSKYLDGKPIGPFNYRGRRKDDPNDRIDHENRRELRGLRIFAAWLNHWDTKQHNSLDVYVTEGDRSYVKHYLIDFASTLGAGAEGPEQRYGSEFTVDATAFFGRVLALGFHEDPWRRIHRPEGLNEVGYYESIEFDPLKFKPLQPNTAFENMTMRDAYWAAKIITSFRDDHIQAVVREVRYHNPEAERYVTRVLTERRDKIGRSIFDKMPPLDFFQYKDGRVDFRDLGVERGIYPSGSAMYRARVSAVDGDGNTRKWSDWDELADQAVILSGTPAWNEATAQSDPSESDDAEYPFLAIECQVNRGEGWSRSVRFCVSPKSGRVLAVER